MGLNVAASAISQTLTPLQQLTVQTAIQKLLLAASKSSSTSSGAPPSIQFWGKITGRERDYLILIQSKCNETIAHDFLWSNDNGLHFAQLQHSDFDAFTVKCSPLIRGSFSGNPALKYKDPTIVKKVPVDGEEEAEEEDEPEDEEAHEDDENASQSSDPERVKKPTVRKLTELERLHWTVRAITHATHIVPLGSYTLSASGRIATNRAFDGLGVDKLTDLSQYLLYKDAVEPSTLVRIRKSGSASNRLDFLDSLADVVKRDGQVWIAQRETGVAAGTAGFGVSVRSLVWPGYEFKTQAGESQWEQAYFGTGEQNHDIAFMI